MGNLSKHKSLIVEKIKVNCEFSINNNKKTNYKLIMKANSYLMTLINTLKIVKF